MHDLRNPLNVVRLNLVVAREVADDAERVEVIDDAQAAAERAFGLVTDLLDVSAAEDGLLRVERGAIDVGALIARAAAAWSGAAGFARLDVETASIVAALDAKLIQRVLDNLLGNARRHLAPRGRIGVTVARAYDEVVITISNDGPTLPDAVRRTLFQKYAGESTSGRTRGLGLYFCRLVVEAHEGTIRETAPAEGVCFEIRLPIKPRGQTITDAAVRPPA
ncbi:MAG: HAMP domain-containing sensor histidine kinase [Kofleriaceae bacterium]